MRRAAKVDSNQPQIIAALRSIGATVQPLHMVGAGCPDIAVGYLGMTLLLEIKDGSKPPSARKLTKDEQAWHEGWKGHVDVVEDVEEALSVVLAVRDRINRERAYCTVASGDCFTHSRCLGRCTEQRKKDQDKRMASLEARVRGLEQIIYRMKLSAKEPV